MATFPLGWQLESFWQQFSQEVRLEDNPRIEKQFPQWLKGLVDETF